MEGSGLSSVRSFVEGGGSRSVSLYSPSWPLFKTLLLPPPSPSRAAISSVHQHLTEISTIPTSLIEEETEAKDSKGALLMSHI